MNPKIGYNVAKIIGIIRRDKHNETLNKWFIPILQLTSLN